MLGSNRILRAGVLAGLMVSAIVCLPALAAGDGTQARTVPAKAPQCFACHGANGIATMPDAPNLAGQNEGYLSKTLQEFRSGARQHEVMSLMAKGLSDQDIAQLAAYFSKIEISLKQ